MSKVKAVLLSAAVFLCTLLITGCGKSNPSITLTPSGTITINQGATQAITAAVANDVNAAGVTWSLGSSDGTLTNSTKTSVTYVAPSVVSTTTTATVTATSVANSTITSTLTITIDAVLGIATTSLPVGTQNVAYFGVISATGASGTFDWTITSGSLPAGLTLASSSTSSVTISGTPTTLGTSKFTMQVTVGGSTATQALSITINPPPPLSVATKVLPNATVNTPYTATLQASSGTQPYAWSIISGTLPAGLTLSGATISGTPSATSTNPPPTFEVQVMDSSTPVQTATATLGILINPSQSFNAQLTGTYAFLVRGFTSGAPYAIAGSLVLDGTGKITWGVIDDPVNGLLNQPITANTGTYLIDSDGLGTLTFGTPTTRTFAVALVPPASGSTVSTTASLVECDDTTCTTGGSGVLVQQTTSAFGSALAGPYAFGFQGTDSSGGRYGLAGAFTIGTGGFLDSDDAGTALSDAAITVSGGAVPDPTTGRSSISITSAQGTTTYSFYVVKPTELLAVEIDTVAPHSLVGGTILQQSTSPTLNAVGVFETTSFASTALSQVGLLTPSSGSMTTSFDQSTGGGIVSGSGTYTVGANGRVTFSGSGLQGSGDPVLYLASANEGFLVGTDGAVTLGFIEPQSGTGSFALSSLTGTYAGGSLAPITSAASSQIDIGVADGAGNLSLTSDIASNPGGLIQGASSTPTYTLASTGRGVLSSGPVFYMVSGTEFWLLNSSGMIERFNSTQPGIAAIF